jgi:hypothetical protein
MPRYKAPFGGYDIFVGPSFTHTLYQVLELQRGRSAQRNRNRNRNRMGAEDRSENWWYLRCIHSFVLQSTVRGENSEKS